MAPLTLEQKLHYTLRLAIAMCFIGHGAFGIITKPIWVNYFAVFGIGKYWAYNLMPVVGTLDISLGILVLIKPYRIIVLWLVIWGLITAALRPLSGEPFAELIERAGNFGAPLALLILSGGIGSVKDLFKPIDPDIKANSATWVSVSICLRIVAFLLLAGHGWLNVIGKKGLLDEYSRVGLTNTMLTAQVIGFYEIVAGLLILVKPFKSFIFILLVWKILSELFYPHWEVFEWIERGGSYCTLLALFFITDKIHLKNIFAVGRVSVGA